jgi:hypothetical protein
MWEVMKFHAHMWTALKSMSRSPGNKIIVMMKLKEVLRRVDNTLSSEEYAELKDRVREESERLPSQEELEERHARLNHQILYEEIGRLEAGIELDVNVGLWGLIKEELLRQHKYHIGWLSPWPDQRRPECQLAEWVSLDVGHKLRDVSQSPATRLRNAADVLLNEASSAPGGDLNFLMERMTDMSEEFVDIAIRIEEAQLAAALREARRQARRLHGRCSVS